MSFKKQIFPNKWRYWKDFPTFGTTFSRWSMPNPYFSFKRFTVYHDRCAMKVGTDGVLLGAWTPVSSARRVLDIGTGTGLISLMLAQRCSAYIKALDIVPEAVEQAKFNVAASPWSDRIEVELQDICRYVSHNCFDVVVSNPPYFVNSLKCPDTRRNTARHTDSLDFESLIMAVTRLLSPEGVFSVIIPTDGMQLLVAIASQHGLYMSHQTLVHTKPEAEAKRVLLSFKRFPTKCITDSLVIELSRHIYSKEYIALTQDFYLNM